MGSFPSYQAQFKILRKVSQHNAFNQLSTVNWSTETCQEKPTLTFTSAYIDLFQLTQIQTVGIS